MRGAVAVLFFLSLSLWAGNLPARAGVDEVAILKREVEELKATVRQLQNALEELRRGMVSKAGQAQPSPGQQPRGALFNILNPNISVIGDMVGKVTDDEADRLSLREVEIGFQASVDPYARADFFLSVKDLEEVEIEEGFITALTLPWRLQAKGGKYRANFGKQNRIHTLELLTVDRPKVLRNFFGEEGLAVMGLHANRLVPNPWDKFIEFSLEVFNGDNEVSFAGEGSDRPVYLGHLKNFFDLTEASSLELGLSGATSFNDREGRFRTTLAGLDVTFRWRPSSNLSYLRRS